MKIKFLFKVVRNESRADVETDFKKTILSMFHRYSTRSRNFVGIIGGWTRNRRNLQIRSTTFSLIPNYRRNVTSVRIYTHTHAQTHRRISIAEHFALDAAIFQGRETISWIVAAIRQKRGRKKNERHRNVAKRCNKRLPRNQMDAFVAGISNVFPCWTTKINLLDIFFRIDRWSIAMVASAIKRAENEIEFSSHPWSTFKEATNK